MRSPSYILLIIVLLILSGFIGVLAYLTFNPPAKTRGLASEASEARPLNIQPPSRPVVASTDPVRGALEAPITIVEFGDFFCVACAEAAVTLEALLQANKDKIKLVWKDFPNTARHPLARKAHEAARCAAEQGAFWEYHDLLFDRQLELTERSFVSIAQEAGLEVGRFEECVSSEKTKELVTRSFNEGLLLRVDATPYFFVNTRRISGAVPEQELQTIIDTVRTTP